MFPTGGASTLKGFTPAFGTTAAGGSATSSDPHFDRHHIHHHRGQEDGPVEQLHPIRPVRHVQHAAQWAETKTIQAPGLIVRSTTATVSQWTEYSATSSVQQMEVILLLLSTICLPISIAIPSKVSRTTSSTQFQTIRNQPPAITSAQYLDDLQVFFHWIRFLSSMLLKKVEKCGNGCLATEGGMRNGITNGANGSRVGP